MVEEEVVSALELSWGAISFASSACSNCSLDSSEQEEQTARINPKILRYYHYCINGRIAIFFFEEMLLALSLSSLCLRPPYFKKERVFFTAFRFLTPLSRRRRV